MEHRRAGTVNTALSCEQNRLPIALANDHTPSMRASEQAAQDEIRSQLTALQLSLRSDDREYSAGAAATLADSVSRARAHAVTLDADLEFSVELWLSREAAIGDDEARARQHQALAHRALGGIAHTRPMAAAQYLELSAFIAKSGGRSAEAADNYREAVALLTGADSPDAAYLLTVILANYADLVERQGAYASAIALYRQAMTRTDDDGTRASLQANLGRASSRLGLFKEAISYQRKALAYRRKQGSVDAIAESLAHLGKAYSGDGRFAEAEDCLREATETYAAVGGREYEHALTLNNLGSLYLELEQYGDADTKFGEALAVLDARALKAGPTARAADLAAIVTSNQGNVAYQRGEYDVALATFEKAAQTLHALDPQHRELDTLEQKETTTLLRLGRVTEASDIAARALAARPLAGTPRDADWLATLSDIDAYQGDVAAALKGAEGALAATRRIYGDHYPETTARQLNVAALLGRQGLFSAALQQAQDAEGARDKYLTVIFAAQTDNERLRMVKEIYRDMHVTIEIALRAPTVAAIRQAYELVLRRKSIVVEAASAALVPRRGLAREARLLAASIGQAALEGRSVAADTAEYDRLQERLARRDRPALLAPSVETLADALPRDSMLIEYVRIYVGALDGPPGAADATSGSRYVAFSLGAGEPGSLTMADLGEAGKIDSAVARWRSTITGRDETVGRWPVGGPRPERFLYDTLLGALSETQSGALIVVPDGALTRLPFAALPDSHGVVLVEARSLSIADSGRDVLKWLDEGAVATGDAYVAGDVDYDAGPPRPRRRRRLAYDIRPFGSLSGTRAEASAVAAILGVKPSLGDEAREGRLKRMRNPAVVHLATHGFYLDSREAPKLPNPLLRSGIVLAGFNRALRGLASWPDAEDGVLTAQDLLAVDWRGAGLVTFSACESGLGAQVSNEGVFGLRRSLIIAGVRSVLISLWQVPDEATRELMVAFYRSASTGMPLADALRQAQRAIRAQLPEPRYWAAFVVCGDPGPMMAGGSTGLAA